MRKEKDDELYKKLKIEKIILQITDYSTRMPGTTQSILHITQCTNVVYQRSIPHTRVCTTRTAAVRVHICIFYCNNATIATNDSTYLHLFHRLHHASFAPRSLPKSNPTYFHSTLHSFF